MNIDNELVQKCKDISLAMRKDSMVMSLAAKQSGSHLGGSLSCVEIIAALYYGVMKFDPKNPTSEDRDRFMISKGHGVVSLYAVLYELGIISAEELETFKSNDTFLTGHPTINVERGVEFSSGSLGQGLSLGVGTCLALKHKKNEDSRAFVLLGDGECNEGSVWEAAMSASHYGLKNLVAIIDKNELQYDGTTDDIMSMGDLSKKWEAFGWTVKEVDGHDVGQLIEALSDRSSDKPLAVIAHTVKGKGISFMENNPKWHHSVLSQKLYDEAMQELEGSND